MPGHFREIPILLTNDKLSHTNYNKTNTGSWNFKKVANSNFAVIIWFSISYKNKYGCPRNKTKEKYNIEDK